MGFEVESRIGKAQSSDEQIYSIVSDFNNLGSMLPPEQVKDFKSDADSCSFQIDNIGRFGMRIIEREPSKLIKVESDKTVPFKFNLWIQLKKVSDQDTRIKVTLKADLNPMMKMVAKKPLTNFVEMLVSRLEAIR